MIMILTGGAINEAIRRGEIYIYPFRDSAISENSYTFRLGSELLVFPTEGEAQTGDGVALDFPKEGLVFQPGRLYLGATLEQTASLRYSQMLFGNRSLGSLGVWVQITAPLGHVGSKIRWTLEISVTKPVILSPGMDFGKILFINTVKGAKPYGHEFFSNSGKYVENNIRQCAKYPEIELSRDR